MGNLIKSKRIRYNVIKAFVSTVGVTFTLDISVVSIYPLILLMICGYIFLHNKEKNIYANMTALIFSLFLTLGKIDFIIQAGFLAGCVKAFFILIGNYLLLEWGVGYIFLVYDTYRENVGDGIGRFKLSHNIVGIFSFIVFSAVYIFVWLCEYPGIISGDSLKQIKQIVGMIPLVNHHPVAHTLWIKLWYVFAQMIGMKDIIEIIGFITFVQLLLQSAVFAFITRHIYKKTQNMYMIFFTLFFYGLLPYNCFYSVTIWKDVVHGWISGLLLISLNNYLSSKNNNGIFLINIFILGVAFCLFRNNAYYAFILWGIFTCIYKLRKKNYRLIGAILMAILTSTVIKGPLYSWAGVVGGGYGENLSVPIQQIACVIANDRELKEDERELIEKVTDIGVVSEKYTNYISDPVKFSCNFDSGYFPEHKSEYFVLWLKLGLRYPKDYLTAYIKQTYGYWYPDTSYWVYYAGILSDKSDNIGLTKRAIVSEKLTENVRSLGGDVWEKDIATEAELYDAAKIPIYASFFNLGTFTWILICVMIYSFYRRQQELFIPYLLLFCIFISLMMATPVYAEFRYYYSVVVCLPLMLFLPMKRSECI